MPPSKAILISWKTKKANIQEAMNTVDGSDYGKLSDLQKQNDELDVKINDKMERWEYLSQFDN
ncbi:ATPase components of ABC transporters with duplicated ATPase domains [Lentilactobacillus kosonis]|uniref:ATPase components of ABC transporters with duplicated ATPase domains n=1 Tax=Lentilactobacillus kosonis TaxID=2810561 RepID=A0A401FL10_9LACO|nr:ATPase components of ABC transporters with duplicated ATPase domains [Lentilactobacillus kosonis]